jgi:outer membrane protein assembly factor BamA
LLALALGAPFALAQPAAPERGTAAEASGIEAADAALVAPEAPSALEALAGKPVRGVSVETVGRLWQERPTLRSIANGEPLSGAVARRALRELLDTGDFAHATADARPYEDGVILRIVAVPRRIVSTVEVEGGVLELPATLAAARIAEGGELTEALLGQIPALVRRHYRRLGYDRASVQVELRDTDDPRRVALTLRIDPGEERTVTRRVFVVEPRLDALVGDLRDEYDVEEGDRLDEEALAEADGALADKLQEAGFLGATVRHRVVRQGPYGFLYVYLLAGPLYRLRFEGNRRFDAREIEDALELGTAGGDPNPAALAERVRTFYRLHGFHDARVDGTLFRLDGGTVRETRLTIVEGEPLRVRRRLYPCLPPDPPDDLDPSRLDDEVDGILEEELPVVPLFHDVDEPLVDHAFGGGFGSPRRAPQRMRASADVYVPEAYDRAVEHLRTLLHSKGYLNAAVGPATLLRPRCERGARGCQPAALPPLEPRCARDALELPVDEPPLSEGSTCEPDPRRGRRCAPVADIVIPIQLGPQTRLWDLGFEGNVAFASPELAAIAELELGAPFSSLAVDAARLRLLNRYRDLGYAYAAVRAAVETSPDRTRARVRFIVNEHKPVVITGYEVRGAVRTSESLILSRLALCQKLETCTLEERYFKRELVRESEEQIATLGAFSSVSISLEDPDIPEQYKRVVITVVEQRSQYLEPRVGFSTGEGVRLAIEYGHRNVGGRAIGLTVRLELAFLPDFLILDDQVRENYRSFVVSERLERRNRGSLRFPDIGLGPKVELTVDGLDVRDNQRDFGLTREALVPTITYRPWRPVSLQFGGSTELNDVKVFGAEDVEAAVRRNPRLATLLRVPDGRTLAVAQRVGATWDRRDSAFEATRGTLFSVGVEHVSAFPMNDDTVITSEFLRFTGRGAGYLRLTDGGMALAVSVGTGYNQQLTSDSQTYPDRLFYLGGVSTLRGFQLDSVVPEDVARRVLRGELTIDQVAVRGGNFFINPRAELRIPLTGALSTAVFIDSGNVWSAVESIEGLDDLIKLRYAMGAGMRLATPVGPVALDYGINLVRRPWEDFGAFHFAIGLF